MFDELTPWFSHRYSNTGIGNWHYCILVCIVYINQYFISNKVAIVGQRRFLPVLPCFNHFTLVRLHSELWNVHFQDGRNLWHVLRCKQSSPCLPELHIEAKCLPIPLFTSNQLVNRAHSEKPCVRYHSNRRSALRALGGHVFSCRASASGMDAWNRL